MLRKTFLDRVLFSISKTMRTLFSFNFVHIVLFNDRRTHIPSLVMMLKLGKKISVENQSVLSTKVCVFKCT